MRKSILTKRTLRLTVALVATALWARCSPGPGEPGHPELACVSCHNGGLADRRLASAPERTCTSSLCHFDGGPEEVLLGSVTFPHRGHADTARVRPSCAGCHTHPRGGEPLTASTDGCALCHAREIDGRREQDCLDCHSRTEHRALTSQGLSLPHDGPPLSESPCTRCHYDVATPSTQVSARRCASCHTDPDSATALPSMDDAHATHDGLACVGCHVAASHRIVAMSSAVSLQCADCHASEHAVRLAPEWPGPGLCSGCHDSVHRATQALVLGVVPGMARAVAAYKFLNGLTCRSCHVRVGDVPAPAFALRGQPGSCGSCHLPQYDRIPAWWREGAAERQRLVERYVSRARSRLGLSAEDSIRILLDESDGLLGLLAEGGAHHNIELADQLFRDALTLAQRAYRRAGLDAPRGPDLGSPPEPGFCTYCHFDLTASWPTRVMPTDFHEEAVSRVGLGRPRTR